ncbi:MAG: hypothetical protein E7391_02820 [Ruminococcaceae bacterium]|nr:hypothetical protein [Oscillospiraceae bacterium]
MEKFKGFIGIVAIFIGICALIGSCSNDSSSSRSWKDLSPIEKQNARTAHQMKEIIDSMK